MTNNKLILKYEEDYRFTTRPNIDDHHYIRILTGDFVGVIFRFLVVKLIPGDPPHFLFSFEIAESPNFSIESLETSNLFKETLGAILDSVINFSIEQKKIKEHDNK
jgi:hypothetical protein